ncbi:MAG TPA: c-type cytochrome [Candidatus Acidoferrum sp.]|jgi:cytochrome c oxidase cbb3-type subunit 3|nr:c-type cytochrome [Candidatus Acidoferrum sp.]
MLFNTKSFSVLVAVLVVLCAATGFLASSQTPQQTIRQKDSKAVSTPGMQTFASTCASCHGLDGRGGERAPNIADSAKAQRLSDAQITHIIENGIPGTGMPAFHSLEGSNIKAVVTYLRTLQGTRKPVKLPGDPERGKTIFLGKAGCSNCHMAAGQGGFIASDLSGYARTHNQDEIRSAIIDPVTSGDRQARLVTAILRGGEKYVGRIRNEDNFSLQLQTMDGTFQLIAKSNLEELEYNSQTLMPPDYASTLSRDELNDVVSYLMRVANASASQSQTPKKEFEDE